MGSICCTAVSPVLGVLDDVLQLLYATRLVHAAHLGEGLLVAATTSSAAVSGNCWWQR